MKKEIGGYFELEDFGGKEYYPNLYKVNLGRTALRWLLEGRGYTKIYLPVFLCESVTEACEQRGIRISRYQLDAELNVLLPRKKLGESECLYLVNYYGQLTDEKILAYQKIFGNIIVDHTHAFFQKPLKVWIPCIPAENSGESVMEHIFPQMQCFRWISQWIIPIKEWDISLGGTKKMQASTIRRCFRMQLGMKAWRFDVCPG